MSDEFDVEPDAETHTAEEIQAWRDDRDAFQRSREELRAIDAGLDKQLAAAATRSLLRAAAHADDPADPTLSEAVVVNTADLDRVQLTAVIRYLAVRCAALTKSVDELTGSLERIAGTGSLARITNALERPDSDDDPPPPASPGSDEMGRD